MDSMEDDTTTRLAITVEWNIPGVTKGPGPLPVTRYSIQDPGSVESLIQATEKAKSNVNEILTHVVEKGILPTLAAEITPKCVHGFPYTKVDCLYSPSHHTATELHPNQVIAKYVKKMLHHSRTEMRTLYGGQLDVVYGPNVNEKMDIYGTDILPSDAPVFAYIHGGYWQEGSNSGAIVAPTMVPRGIIAVSVEYDLVPTTSLSKIVDEIINALYFLNNWCTSRGSSGFYFCGHSTGAHLIMAAIGQTAKAFNLLKGLFLISGVYDLVPLIGTYIDRPLGLTTEAAISLSPFHQIQHLPKLYQHILTNVNIHIIIGEFESAAFMEQSRKFLDVLTSLKLSNEIQYHVISNSDHFSLIENLDDLENDLFKLLLRLMNTVI